MFTLNSNLKGQEEMAIKVLLIVLLFLIAVACVLIIINAVLTINQKALSKKMDLERYEKRRKNRWQ